MTTAIDALRDSLSDPDCTDWQCPGCGRFEPKEIVIADTKERMPCRLECSSCGFDAWPYRPGMTPEIAALDPGIPF